MICSVTQGSSLWREPMISVAMRREASLGSEMKPVVAWISIRRMVGGDGTPDLGERLLGNQPETFTNLRECHFFGL